MPSIDLNLRAEASLAIQASPAQVWRVLTEPRLIEKFLFGTQTKTDWAVGSPITFSGVYGPDRVAYCDRGVVQENVPGVALEFTYWSGFSGLPDTPENYGRVRYELSPSDQAGTVLFTWRQTGFVDETRRGHSQAALTAILPQIKALAEATLD